VQLLFDRCEEAVQIDVQKGEAIGLGGEGHRRIHLRLYSLYLRCALSSFRRPDGLSGDSPELLIESNRC
jgi:hypothetical protein